MSAIQTADFETRNQLPLTTKTIIPSPTATSVWNLQQQAKGFRFFTDSKGNIWTFPVIITDTQGNVQIDAASVADADPASLPSGNMFPYVIARPQVYNNATWEKPRANYNVTDNASDTTTTTYTGSDQTTYNARAAIVIFNVTALTGVSASWQSAVQFKDPASGNYYNYATLPAAATGVGTAVWTIGLTAATAFGAAAAGGSTAIAAQTNADAPLARIIRLVVIKTSATAYTASYGILFSD